eukprot:TRINITY_DN4260_c0_g1_i1.p1 TRINITY_DN4260_c0_g1~~TRINITY_DN4260_c0_g1_i1.p1  ORF type:complete len:108 (-),score=4.99 TRINITY_DN4260_c0_g1_i1:93-416(-)
MRRHQGITLIGIVLFGLAFVFDGTQSWFWVLMGIGITFILLSASASAVRHHKHQKTRIIYIAYPCNEETYLVPIHPVQEDRLFYSCPPSPPPTKTIHQPPLVHSAIN